MMFNLVKKDFLLVKRYLLLTAILAFGIPLFLLWRVPIIMGFPAFMITVIFTVYIPLQSVLLAETNYPKAIALLCTAPYPRSTVVKARYLFFLILFLYCYLAYAILSLLVPQIEMISLLEVVLALLFFSIIFGIYLPLQYKLGFEKMRNMVVVFIIATSFSLPFIVKALAKASINFDIFTELPLPIRYAVLFSIILLVAAISLATSIKIFQRKEL